MKLGYARVSTTDQDLAIQRTRLHEAGCEKLSEEKISGARKKRPVLERLLSELRADDVVVVTRLDRLARSTSELLRIAETIEEKNAGLQSIAEPWADTTTPAGRMVLTVFAGIAEFERSLIATRTEEGRRAAQARGVPFGRPPKLRPDQRTLARNLIEEGKSVSEIARTFNVHAATIYRCLPRRGGLMTVHRSARTHGPCTRGVALRRRCGKIRMCAYDGGSAMTGFPNTTIRSWTAVFVLALLVGTAVSSPVAAADASVSVKSNEAVETELGLTREDRRGIQRALSAAGFRPGKPDGLFGRRTRTAITEWQKGSGGGADKLSGCGWGEGVARGCIGAGGPGAGGGQPKGLCA